MEKNIAKNIKSHGMTSDKASRVKIRGHRKEYLFAELIDGIVLKGTDKQDVMNAYGQYFSVKGGSEIQKGEGREGRIQVFLYNRARFQKEVDFPADNIINDIFNCYPKTYEEYQNRKDEVKKNIAIQMRRLKDYLLDETNRTAFLDRVFFDRKVDFFVVYDDDVFHIFDKDEVWNIFLKNLEVDNSCTCQKVVFKYKVLCAEIEMRTTEGSKYPSMFMPMRKRVMFNLLTKKIPRKKELKHNLWLYGKAIKKYKG